MTNSEAIRQKIGSVSNDLRLTRLRAIHARNVVARFEALAIQQLSSFKGCEDLMNSANSGSEFEAFIRSDPARDGAAAAAVLKVLEASPEYAEAARLLDPLHAELEAAEASELEAAHQERLAEQAVLDAETAALEKLKTKVAADPAVVKARAAIAGIRRLGEPLVLEEELAEMASDALDLGRELAADLH